MNSNVNSSQLEKTNARVSLENIYIFIFMIFFLIQNFFFIIFFFLILLEFLVFTVIAYLKQFPHRPKVEKLT
jgi:hypothetical protein